MTDKTSETKLPDNIDWSNDPTKHKCSGCGHTKEMHIELERCDVLFCGCMKFSEMSSAPKSELKEKCRHESIQRGEWSGVITCQVCGKEWYKDDFHDFVEEIRQQARKETAEEILDFLNKYSATKEHYLNELKKRYGVE